MRVDCVACNISGGGRGDIGWDHQKLSVNLKKKEKRRWEEAFCGHECMCLNLNNHNDDDDDVFGWGC